MYKQKLVTVVDLFCKCIKCNDEAMQYAAKTALSTKTALYYDSQREFPNPIYRMGIVLHMYSDPPIKKYIVQTKNIIIAQYLIFVSNNFYWGDNWNVLPEFDLLTV